MRKNIFRICIVAVLALAVLAVSVVTITGKMNIPMSEDGSAEELPESFDIDFMGEKNIRLTYHESCSIKEGTADIYKDETGNDFIYKNGKLRGYYFNGTKNPMSDVAPVGKDAAVKIAEEWLPQFTEHPEKYELQTFEEKESYGLYYVTLARKVGEIFTDENAEFSVMYDGVVLNVSVQYAGKYDGISQKVAKGLTEDVIRTYAESQIALIYPDTESEFVMNSYVLTKDENGYYISIYGKIGDSLEVLRYYFDDSYRAAKKPDNAFPAEPDKIIVGSDGVEKEILPGEKAYKKIVSYVRERADKSDAFGTLLLDAYDFETREHFSYRLRESETFVEFIYDECKGQTFNMMQSGGGSADEEKEIKRIFLSLTGEEHNDIFISHDDEYKSSATLGLLTDSTELITYVNDLVKK